MTKVVGAPYGLPVTFETIGVAPGTPVLTTFATFDGAPSAGVVVSNGNRTVTHGTTNNGTGVKSTTFLTTGRFYFEVTATLQSTTDGAGIALAAATFLNMQNGTNSTTVMYGTSNTFICTSGASTGKNLGATANGDVFGFAIDLTARLAWIRRNGGNWNNDGTASPATGVGGVTIVAGSFAPAVTFTNSSASNNQTGNFGQAAFAFTAPSGFSLGWGT